jgi:hypothetical protein
MAQLQGIKIWRAEAPDLLNFIKIQ